jgi:hypothetical protein
MTFGDIFTDINLDIPTLNIKLSFWMFATSKEMAKIVTKQQNDLIFGRKKLFAHGEVTSIKYYVIKFVSDLRQVGGFLRVLLFPPPIKLAPTI